MTIEQAFHQAVTHCINQKARSVDENGKPAYRGKDNLRGAIGCLIPDDKYDYRMEGRNIYSVMYSFDLPQFFYEDPPLFDALQLIHDEYPIKEWPAQFRLLAVSYKFQVPLCLVGL